MLLNRPDQEKRPMIGLIGHRPVKNFVGKVQAYQTLTWPSLFPLLPASMYISLKIQSLKRQSISWHGAFLEIIYHLIKFFRRQGSGLSKPDGSLMQDSSIFSNF